MGRCGEAVVLDLNGGVGHGRALPSGGAQSKLERGKAWEGGVVFQRGLGVLFIGPGRSMMVGVYGGVHGDQFGDYTATVQRLVVAWGLTGSGKLLESSRRTVRVGELRGGRILPAPSKCSTAVSGEPRRNGDGRGARFLPCGCREVQGCRGEGERGQGGPGGEENGVDGEGDTATVVGSEVDDLFAKTSLAPLLCSFSFFFLLITF